MYICMCMYVCMCVCVCVCMYVCIYVCMYVCKINIIVHDIILILNTLSYKYFQGCFSVNPVYY